MSTLTFIVLFWPVLALIPLLMICLPGEGKLRVRPMFAYYDCWMGVYLDRSKQVWYWFPVPMLGLKIWRDGAHDER